MATGTERRFCATAMLFFERLGKRRGRWFGAACRDSVRKFEEVQTFRGHIPRGLRWSGRQKRECIAVKVA
jgi:hypothetical protein